VVSRDELNDHLRTVIIAPLTTAGRSYPWRVGRERRIQTGSEKRIGALPDDTLRQVLDGLREMFAA
jgi:mRNA interferase MazF